MIAEKRMTFDEQYRYLRMMRARHLKVERQERGQMLDEMAAVTGLHGKSSICRVHSSLLRQAPSCE